MNLFQRLWLTLASLGSLSPPSLAQTPKSSPIRSQIEGLTPPKAAKPPRPPRSQGEIDELEQETERLLRKKRKSRHKRQLPKDASKPDLEEVRQSERLKDAQTPRDRVFCLELALVGGTVLTSGDRSGYTYEPNVHINGFYRLNSSRFSGKLTPWVGFRLAPFTGSGFHENNPGHYGLTYFGPMIGVGKVEPGAEDSGPVRTNISGEIDFELPIISGYAATFGIAGVSSQGKRETQPTGSEPEDDFQTKQVKFDAPGVWLEFRYFRIYQSAASADFVFGAQGGASKVFIYSGVGFGGWY